MKVSSYLFKSTESIWKECCEHPFVQGIGNGTLETDKFRYYVKQDYLYLLYKLK